MHDGIVGAILVGLLAIFLLGGVFHCHITGEPSLDNVPLLRSIFVAALLVAIWSGFARAPVSSHTMRVTIGEEVTLAAHVPGGAGSSGPNGPGRGKQH